MKGLNVVFMGTPEFAVPTLESIHRSRHHIVGVVSQPDRIRARGRKVLPAPVVQYSLDHLLSPILQPEKMKDPQFIAQLRSLNADIFVVVAFRILPEIVFAMPQKGTINLHPSLLPRYRGAAPINWTLINGDRETGITTMFIQKEIDAGNIIMQEKQPVHPDDTFGTLHDRLAPLGAEMILGSLDRIQRDAVTPLKQDDTLATPAPKLSKEMCRLDFALPAGQVRNWIHGLSPFPGAYASYEKQLLKFFRAEVITEEGQIEAPGTLLRAAGETLWIACSPGIIAVQELQLQGKRRMDVADFLRGSLLNVGEILS